MTEIVGILDPRIYLETKKKFGVLFGALKWEHYTLPATGKGNSLLTWSNFITLGTNRIYSDTFEIQYTLKIRMPAISDLQFPVAITDKSQNITINAGYAPEIGSGPNNMRLPIAFQPFPLHYVTDQITININGQVCGSRPSETLYPRMRYMSREKLEESYVSTCPIDRPYSAAEPGVSSLIASESLYKSETSGQDPWMYISLPSPLEEKFPTLCPRYKMYMQVELRDNSSAVNFVLRDCEDVGVDKREGFKNYEFLPRVEAVSSTGAFVEFTVTITEPIMCAPFSSRLDKTYGRPIFNVNNLDIQYNLNDLRRMLCVSKSNFIQATGDENWTGWRNIINPANIQIDILSADLKFQVATLKPEAKLPLTYISPYPEYVAYSTEYSANPIRPPSGDNPWVSLSITSGVYTIAQIPQSIYIFVGPTDNDRTKAMSPAGISVLDKHPHSGNIRQISISMGNNTKLLSTLTPMDLYRICKQNGLDDSFNKGFMEYISGGSRLALNNTSGFSGARGKYSPYFSNRQSGGLGCGSVLRLIPGIDIFTPDLPLIPGTVGNNIVFQVTVDVDYPVINAEEDNIALWVIFERCGILSLTTDGGSLDMVPIKNPEEALLIAAENADLPEAITLDGTGDGGSGLDYYRGSGLWDTLKSIAKGANKFLKKTGLISTGLSALSNIPQLAGVAGPASSIAKSMGYGMPLRKRIRGGAVMGSGPGETPFYD